MQKERRSSNGCALISIQKRMILNEGIQLRGSFGLDIVVQIVSLRCFLLPSQSRKQYGEITDSVTTARFLDQTTLDKKNLFRHRNRITLPILPVQGDSDQ
jgi:hypothetical protein